MAILVRMRIAMADEPGALAAVASVIAARSGNIVGVDVQRQEGGAVVDDVTVEFADPSGPEAVRDDLAGLGTATLVSLQAAHQRDPVVAALGHAGAMLGAGGPAGVESALVAAVGEVCGAPVVWCASAGDPTAPPIGRLAVDRGGAAVERAGRLDVPGAEVLPSTSWLLAVPDPVGTGAGRVVFAARGPAPFTATEVTRVEALMALAGQLAAG